MPYLILNQDDSISEIEPNDTNGGVLVEDISLIIQSPIGHSVFDYIGGQIVLNTSRQEAVLRPQVCAAKVSELKRYALNSMPIPIGDLDALELITEVWLSIAPAARSPTADFQLAIDIRQAAKDAVAVIRVLSDTAAIESYDVATSPSWPA